jgi:hypothetical protein
VPEFLEDMPNTWNNDCALVYYTWRTVASS